MFINRFQKISVNRFDDELFNAFLKTVSNSVQSGDRPAEFGYISQTPDPFPHFKSYNGLKLVEKPFHRPIPGNFWRKLPGIQCEQLRPTKCF
jgi:hypothetical protein